MLESATTALGQELRDASDDVIADAVMYADPMVLRGVLYQLTGDAAFAGIELNRVRVGFFEVPVVAREEDNEYLRKRAVEFLVHRRDSGGGQVEIDSDGRLSRSASLTVGQSIPDDELELWLAELGLDPWARGLQWLSYPTSQRLENFSVTVIGAGMGGLSMAVQLKHAGIPFTVVEKNSGVGGTWFENHYPGARVDTPSRSYNHVFGVDYPYSYAFCPWEENEDYFNWVADTFSVRNDIVFNTEVRSLDWNEAESVWEITAAGPNGEQHFRSNVVVTAVGFLNRPKLPEIKGMSDFAGESCHSARWPEGLDLQGKRVAVIGTGCSGYQMAPELALEVDHLTIFQRTPQWLFGVPGYRSPLPPQVGWLDQNLPLHRNFMRLAAAFRFASATTSVEVVNIDPNFKDSHAISAGNKQVRDSCIAFLEQKLGDPELVAKMTPPHPPFSARPVLIDPDYSVLEAIQRDNVTLVTDGIRRIDRTGVETTDGVHHDVDVIVYATGFQASDYLSPMKITGRNGMTTDELWHEDGPRAYLGCMMPGLPNFWTIYGPNTNGCLLVGAFHEMITLYALKCMERLILRDESSVEVKKSAYARYNELIDERGARRAYNDARTKSYYRSDKYGRSVTNCPLSASEMWQFLRQPDPRDLIIQ